MTNEELAKELREEIRKLREELRNAGTRIQFVPQPYPVYVPALPQPVWPQPYQPPYSPTIIWGNVAGAPTTIGPLPVVTNTTAARQDVTVYGGLHFT